MNDIRFRVVIVDDETPARRLLEEYVSGIPELMLTGVSVIPPRQPHF